ncbi:hypothetical protein A4U61_27170 [Streptomyces sp. H-KF8]|uniref:wHTH domain-containing protein n=1 Tax=Streptomyces sp. H-KF8 TaxID=1727216 RepID=UPI0007ED66CE|nr:hypothetical protein [Streptomyces sp. H-KF8]OBQ48735.1 hypothetical protein A4U61_27170 [Streptomyces sp. H-KF8]
MTALPVPHPLGKATVPNDPASLDDHDRRLISRELNSRAPWLDPEEPVTPGHVLRAAGRGGDPGAVGSRLTELGYRAPPNSWPRSPTTT